MKAKLFLDTNIVIDYIAHRTHFLTYLNGPRSNYTWEENGNFIVNEPIVEYRSMK